MKTRQQRLAEERAGHPSSPPQQLAVKTRGPRRTRAKQPSVGEAPASSPTPVAGSGQVPVVAEALAPAAQLAVPREAQALLRLWVDVSPELVASGRPVNGPTIELAIPSAEVADLLAFIESLRQTESQRKKTPTRMASQTSPARTEPALQRSPPSVQSSSTNERVFTLAPHITLARIEPAIQSNSAPAQSPKINNPIHTMSHMAPHTTPTRIEPAIQSNYAPARSPKINNPIETMSHMTPHATPTRIEPAIPSSSAPDQSPKVNNQIHHTMSQMAPHTTPTRIEPAIQSSSAPAQSPNINKPIYTMSQMAPRTTPTRIEPALQNTPPPVRSPNINKVIDRMSHSVLGQTANKNSTRQPVPSSRETPNIASILAVSCNRSLPVAYSADGAALYGNLLTTTNASGLNASFDDHEVYRQLDDDASINGDSNMEDVSDSGSPSSNLVESSPQEATQSTLERSPETPQGSGWGLGNLFQSAHDSMARRFGFSPLTPISERSEPTPQMRTVKTAQTQAETPAQMHTEKTTPKKPKKKNSVPTSARAIRARDRRHNHSFAETGKSITIGQNRRDQKSLAKKAIAASRSPEPTVTEDENSPAKRPIHRNHEEAQKTQTLEPDMTPTIRFPSRFLDRTLASKRKRWGSPDTVPNPKGKGYGLGEAESYGSPEEDGVTEQQPGKLRRTSKSVDFSSQGAGNPDKARPYTGSMFEKSTVEYNGGNVFSEYYGVRLAEEAGAKKTNISQQCPAKTPIPITNLAGTFKVPSPGDSDWSNSESEEEEEEMHAAGFEGVTPSRTKNGEHGLALPALRPSEPPKPQQIMKPVAESEALRRARDKALKHKPRYPSRLGQSSMTCSSPPVSNEGETSGRSIYDAYENWCKTAPTAVAAAVERMEVDPNLAGNAFEEALNNAGPAGRANFNAYEEWCKTASPAVIAVLGMMAVDANLAGDAFKGGLSDFASSAKGAEQAVA